MPKEMAFKIIDECASIGVPALKFNWRGESTMHRDYSEIARYAAAKRSVFPLEGIGDNRAAGNAPSFIELLANTNGNCPPSAIDGLMAMTKVMISLDSMDPETYPKMRRGGQLAKAKETIWALVREGHPNIWVRRVLADLNQHEDFVGAVKHEWGESVKVSEHFCFDRNKTESHERAGCDHDDGLKRRYCGYPSQRIIVASTGLVYPCCIDLHETMPVGDIRKQTISEIWEGEPLERLRGELKRGEFVSKACQNCESWMAYSAPQRDFVQDKEIRR